MQLKSFIKKIKKDFAFRKKFIIIGSISLVVLVGLIVFASKPSTDMSASILSLQKIQVWKVELIKLCDDSDGGRKYYVKWLTKGKFVGTQNYTENYDYCLPWTNYLVENFCMNIGRAEFVNDEVVFCENGCRDGACNAWGTGSGYGYGYGYRSTWGTDGYGYGYGYLKIDRNTKQPYVYLIDVFQTYSERVYKSAIKKFGTWVVKHYNTKEFKPKQSTR